MGNSRFAVTTLIVINALVFMAWRFADPAGLHVLAQNFSVSYDLAFTRGRWWTLLTTVFAHAAWPHFLINMFVLNSFGGLMNEVLGTARFLRFYLAAGILGSLCHCLLSNYLLGAPNLGAVGASGALSGLVMLFALTFPREKILIFGLIPLPALFGSVAFVALDLWGLYAQFEGGGLPLGHGAHLGGALAGLIYHFGFRRRRSGSRA